MQSPIISAWWAYFAIMPLLLAVASVIGVKIPFYRKLITQTDASRNITLDGLRGLLATGVFFHHCSIFHRYRLTGSIVAPNSPIFAALGELSVVLFFMATGYLFWGRLLTGRKSSIVQFYWARICRIAPLYFVSVLLICLVVLLQSGGHLREPISVIAKQIACIFSLGLCYFDQLNGSYTIPINSGVTWTLAYEWRFYFVLPFLTWFVRPRRFLVLLALLVGVCLVSRSEIAPRERLLCLDFAAGMLAAHLTLTPTLSWMRGRLGSVIVLLSTAVVALGVPAYSWLGLLCAFVIFLCVIRGVDVFGLLVTNGARLLGTVSYSIYLLHGVVLYLGSAVYYRLFPGLWSNPFFYWAVMATLGVVVVIFGSVTYRWFEHPFMRLPLPGSGRTQNVAK